MDAVTEAERILEEYLRSLTMGTPQESNKNVAFLPIALVIFGVLGMAGGTAFFLMNR